MAKPTLTPRQRAILEQFGIIKATNVPPLADVEMVCLGRKWTLSTESVREPELSVTARIVTEDGEVFEGDGFPVDVAGIKALCAALVATTETQTEMFAEAAD